MVQYSKIPIRAVLISIIKFIRSFLTIVFIMYLNIYFHKLFFNIVNDCQE